MSAIEGLGLGIYSISDAARFTGIKSQAISRWLWGHGGSEPLWHAQYHDLPGLRSIGFRDLIEIRFVKQFREHGVSLHKIRQVIGRAIELMETRYPFSSLEFRSNGKQIFAAYEETHLFLEQLDSGQLLFECMLDRLQMGLSYSDGELRNWRPLGEERSVLLDPGLNFGQPSIDEGVPTRVIKESAMSGQTVAAIADWYDVPGNSVKDALEFESTIAA